MPVGISYDQVDKDSFLGVRREEVLLPIALSATFATASTSIAAASVGTTFTLASGGLKPMFYARRPTLTITDAAGTTLAVTVRVVGRRFGELVVQDIASGTAVAATPVTSNGSRVIDEFVSATIISISNNAASDTASIGIDGSWLGLSSPIRSYKDVLMVYKIANGTPDAAGPKTSSDLSTSLVSVRDSAIDVNTLYSAAVAVTDRYLIEYVAAGSGRQSFRRKGQRFG